MRPTCLITAAAAALILAIPIGRLIAQAPAPVEYYHLVPGFLPESFGDDGMARGNGFAAPNPWGAYTAYLLSTNARGQRTWRIENYLPNTAAGTAQGSTMYLFEGHALALLVDTGQNTTDIPGTNDLTTIVRYLLGHTNDGAERANPVDFVVANTHSHGDHTGKNRLMSDRTLYYPDLDWPRNGAPANYVPIKEGGGPTEHGQPDRPRPRSTSATARSSPSTSTSTRRARRAISIARTRWSRPATPSAPRTSGRSSA